MPTVQQRLLLKELLAVMIHPAALNFFLKERV
jgi:hypothetical protein